MEKFDDISFYGRENEELQKEWKKMFSNVIQEEKQLLLTDLCGRLPYGVKCYTVSYKQPYTLIGIVEDEIFLNTPIHDEGDGKFDLGHEIIKPYLRPMSSMTEKEENELVKIAVMGGYNDSVFNSFVVTDWLNKKMFDYRGLIEKGLALEAPEDMYKTE